LDSTSILPRQRCSKDVREKQARAAARWHDGNRLDETSANQHVGPEQKHWEKWGMKNSKLALFAALAFLIACTAQQPPPNAERTALVTPITNYKLARGCNRAHATIYLPGAYIDAYPGLPPAVEPDHVVLHLSDGTTIWAKPHYGSDDCTNYLNCRRATMILNPIWKQCSPEGIFYEAATEDGRLVFESSAWEITDRATKASVHVGFACGHGFAGQDFTAVSNRTVEGGCVSPTSAATPTGATMAAALALGAAYFNYRASYDRAVHCVADELNATTWSTECY